MAKELKGMKFGINHQFPREIKELKKMLPGNKRAEKHKSLNSG